MVEVKCSKCGETFEGKNEKKAKKKMMKHAKEYHSS
jgi:hypothetical protein